MTFGGNAQASLAIGAPLLSDPVSMPVLIGQRLALLIHYRGATIAASHRPEVEIAPPHPLML
ncbi:hypothetical protein C0V82_22165 (plasmid) [Niveispirillum cyanobacteriorum]|uniref:Uncharacterized protein n=1 Tax=Niveispirillum cyanobacteriorum TaxID=1612173 RepID=A0A2K9NJ61_9PROT|nr:hypothetical protein C0V82_22165 [Niveispirillum cyanobacteriorum]